MATSRSHRALTALLFTSGVSTITFSGRLTTRRPHAIPVCRFVVAACLLALHAPVRAQVTSQITAWTPIAPGVAYAEAADAVGNEVFVGIGGWTIMRTMVDSWVGALYDPWLRAIGVRHLYSIKGPNDIGFQAREIPTLELARHLLTVVQTIPDSSQITVVGHSSGAFVAHALFQDLYDEGGADSTHLTDDRIDYFVLDTSIGTVVPAVDLTDTSAARLGHIYAVYAESGNLKSLSPAEMEALSVRYGPKSSLIRVDASASGCIASWCLHMSLINQKPYKINSYDTRDYSQINQEHPVQWEYLRVIGVDTETSSDLPEVFALEQNYPNPFNPTTTISYDIARSADFSLTVHDVLGREIRVLVSALMPPGSNEVTFNASGLPSGVYFYRLATKDYTQTRQMVLFR